MIPLTRRSFLAQSSLACSLFATGRVLADDRPEGLTAIGGHWHVKSGDPPVYFYEDAGRYLDLFSYHMKDSNQDGIPNIALTHDAKHLIMNSQGYPNHPTAVFPNSGNPNTIRVQKFVFRLPLVPVLAESITRVPMGPIGVAINGVAFFNPFEAGGMNAVEGYSEVWLDSCCGHPQQTGVYHYHKYPSCVKSPFRDDGEQHSPVLGFAFDGFPIYGPYEAKDQLARDIPSRADSAAGTAHALDVCNGHTDSARGYHYHVTPNRFPYVLGGYAGVPEPSNGRGIGRGAKGAIENNAEGESQMERVIVALRPGTATRGKKHTVVFELDPSKARRRAVPEEVPSWIQIGPWEGTHIERKGNFVSCEIDVPADANRGQLVDCHMEFGTEARPTVFKKNDAFRVID